MNAVAKSWHSLHQTVLEDAKLAKGAAHLESPEVPRWIAEAGRNDLAGELCESISNLEGREREKVNDLIKRLCEKGDDIAQRHVIELIDLLRETLVDFEIKQAQSYVDRELCL